MAAVSLKIKSLYKSLPESEKQVADYIVANADKAGIQSISDIAKSANVSIASVSRLSKKLGYRTIKQLKVDVVEGLLPGNVESIFEDINGSDSDNSIIKKIFLGNIKSLDDTLNLINHSYLVKAAKSLARASRVLFLGIGSSGHIVKDAALRFALLDIQAESYSDPQEMLVHGLCAKKGDVVLAFSHSGRSIMTVKCLELAKKNRAMTIGISNYMKSPVHKASDIFLCTSFPESSVKVAALSSRIAQMCIVDCLYLLTARYIKPLKKVSIFNEYAEQMLRLSEK
ncbi:MAG: SIS domain-containing protein [Planctomycetes bacterium]|nr:SIS domain-containing protein [Planctomycetota bacterium]